MWRRKTGGGAGGARQWLKPPSHAHLQVRAAAWSSWSGPRQPAEAEEAPDRRVQGLGGSRPAARLLESAAVSRRQLLGRVGRQRSATSPFEWAVRRMRCSSARMCTVLCAAADQPALGAQGALARPMQPPACCLAGAFFGPPAPIAKLATFVVLC